MNILITGNSSGIGYGLTLHYINNEHTVVGISRRTNHVKHTNHHHIQYNLEDFDGIHRELHESLLAYSHFDLVILNAGILGKIDDLRHQSMSDIHKIMNINVWANKVLLDELKDLNIPIKQVVAISSGSAIKASRGWGPYSISKAALNTLIKSYAHEFPDTHFSSIAPGMVDSEIQEQIRALDRDARFPSIAHLQDASDTDLMPNHMEAGPLLANAFEKALHYDSGTYLDVREM